MSRVPLRSVRDLLAGDHHNGAVQQTALIKVGDEGGQRLVQRRELFADVVRDPGVVVPSAVGNVDHADAGFHQAAGQKEAAAGFVFAVGFG